MFSFFFYKLQLITVLLLICNSCMSWSTRLISLKLCVGFSIFDSVLFLLKFVFLFNKMLGFFHFKNLIIHFKIKVTEKTHTVLLPDLWFLQQQVLKFNDVRVSCSSPKTDLVTNFLNLENRSFENVDFSQL